MQTKTGQGEKSKLFLVLRPITGQNDFCIHACVTNFQIFHIFKPSHDGKNTPTEKKQHPSHVCTKSVFYPH